MTQRNIELYFAQNSTPTASTVPDGGIVLVPRADNSVMVYVNDAGILRSLTANNSLALGGHQASEFVRSKDSPTFGSHLNIEAQGKANVTLSAEDDMSQFTGLPHDANVAGLHIEDVTYIEKHLVVENEVYASAFNQVSDRRLKNHIGDFRLTLGEMACIPLARFSYKNDEEDSVHVGTYAQDVLDILPECVTGDERLALDYSALNTAVSLSLVHYVSEHEMEIKELKHRIDELEEQLRK